jgi:tRNA A-37 threonylcarbamoyl transferase component Bud32
MKDLIHGDLTTSNILLSSTGSKNYPVADDKDSDNKIIYAADVDEVRIFLRLYINIY